MVLARFLANARNGFGTYNSIQSTTGDEAPDYMTSKPKLGRRN